MVQRIVIAMGMHRSGTSLLGGVLKLVGVDLGRGLIQPDQNNLTGYYENQDIVRVHRQLLSRMNRRWIEPVGTLPYPDGWWKTPYADAAREELCKVVRIGLDRSSGAWGFKDPRVSRLIPLWTQIFEDIGVEPVFVLSVRHPIAVAQSLYKRDRIERKRALLLWLTHNLEAIAHARKWGVTVVGYDRWFDPEASQLRRLLAQMSKFEIETDPGSIQAVSAFVRSDLRHHNPKGNISPPLVSEVFRLLEQAAEDGRVAPQLWSVAERFEEYRRVFRSWSDEIDRQAVEPISQYQENENPQADWFQRLRWAIAGRFDRR